MSLADRIYLDFNSTTPCDQRVIEAMLPFFAATAGNAASTHWSGRIAENAVSSARQHVASLIGASPNEVIWTSGSTEANNLAIKGVAQASRVRQGGRHIITQATEHKAVLDPVEYLRQDGFDVTILPVDKFGRIAPAQLSAAVRPDTALVSIMWANNETGTVQPLAQLVAAAKAANPSVVFHTDATQAVGKVAEAQASAGVDLMSFSAHKLYGPKGCGALYVRRTRPPLTLEPLLHGGGHERGFRSGTLNVPGIVGFGEACRLAAGSLRSEGERLKALRDKLWHLLMSQLASVTRNGCPMTSLPNTLNITFQSVSSESLLMACDDIAMSAGSACTSTSVEPSYVLRAMGLTEEMCFSSIRISLGRLTTLTEVQHAASRIISSVQSIRALNAA